MSAKPTFNIISASRRTDIPAFYMPWFMNRLREGYVAYPNPFSGQIHTISVAPEDVHSIVFWSKNYAPFLPHMDELSSYPRCQDHGSTKISSKADDGVKPISTHRQAHGSPGFGAGGHGCRR